MRRRAAPASPAPRRGRGCATPSTATARQEPRVHPTLAACLPCSLALRRGRGQGCGTCRCRPCRTRAGHTQPRGPPTAPATRQPSVPSTAAATPRHRLQVELLLPVQLGAIATSAASCATSWAEPRCSKMVCFPRRVRAICTAVAPDPVRSFRTNRPNGAV